jgi:hypothetical protein
VEDYRNGQVVAQGVFALVSLAFGSLALLAPERILSLVERMSGSKAPSHRWISRSHVIRSVRSGGAIGVVIGLFVLLVTWRNL